ncbi:MAG: VOC family protein [Lutimonas sp.]
MSTLSPFHLAIPVKDLKLCRNFYRDVLLCKEGRSDNHWVDFDFFGHQLVIHQKEDFEPVNRVSNPVDGHDVPIPHFGVVLEWEEWHSLKDKLLKAKIDFVIEPYIRFRGQVGEQATMFFNDPEGNALEFKSFKDMSELFRK